MLGSEQVSRARANDPHLDGTALERLASLSNVPDDQWPEDVRPAEVWQIASRTEFGRARALQLLPPLVRHAVVQDDECSAVPENLRELIFDGTTQSLMRVNADLKNAVAQAYSSARSPLLGQPLEDILTLLETYEEGAAELGLPTCDPIYSESLEASLEIGCGVDFLQSISVVELRSNNPILNVNLLKRFAEYETAGAMSLQVFARTMSDLRDLSSDPPEEIVQSLIHGALQFALSHGAGYDLIASESLSPCLTRLEGWTRVLARAMIGEELADNPYAPDLLAGLWVEADGALEGRPQSDRARAFGAIRVAARELGCEEAFMAHPATQTALAHEPSLRGAEPGAP